MRSRLLEMYVRKLKVEFFSRFCPWARQVLTTIAYRNSSNHESFNIKPSLNTFSNQITICQIWNFTRLSSSKSILETWIFEYVTVFPFLFHFLLKWNKYEIFNIRIQERDGRREIFLAEVTGNSVSDHYARNICIKVFLKIAVLWILVRSKILYLKISKFFRKYLQYV